MSRVSGRYCIVGIGETEYSRWSGRTTLSMACEAILKAARDAGLAVDEIDGIASHQTSAGDSCTNDQVATALGIRTNVGVDISAAATASASSCTSPSVCSRAGTAR